MDSDALLSPKYPAVKKIKYLIFDDIDTEPPMSPPMGMNSTEMSTSGNSPFLPIISASSVLVGGAILVGFLKQRRKRQVVTQIRISKSLPDDDFDLWGAIGRDDSDT
eukprot:91132-Ditylum_brightwellii.AAC.1